MAEVTDLLGDRLPGEAADHLSDEETRCTARIGEMISLIGDEIRASGVAMLPHQERALAVRAVTRLCQEYGGSREYWPKVDSIARALRDARIWADHDGTVDGARGIRALAKRYALSEQQIWSILRAQRAMHLDRVQGRLDLGGES